MASWVGVPNGFLRAGTLNVGARANTRTSLTPHRPEDFPRCHEPQRAGFFVAKGHGTNTHTHNFGPFDETCFSHDERPLAQHIERRGVGWSAGQHTSSLAAVEGS